LGRIQILADDLVSLISAGEVIENPASIVKELIENALDANATNIDIRVSEGGMESIIISDNGSGILKEDCPICTLRHSTSKISRREDIDAILTYGFRGEALASIAAVADLAITTRHEDEKIGTRLVSRAGEIPAQTDASRPQGTTVEVTGLFERIPARRKHLSTPKVESQRILETTMRHAIIRNDVGFRFTKDNRVIIDCPPGQIAETRVLSLWGPDIAKSLVDVALIDQGVTVSGFIARPLASRGNRAREYFSVRKRPIEDSKLSNAVETAYSTLLMKGRFPICAIDIDVDIARVDANIHPTKREVRVQDIDSVTEVVKDAVKDALADVKSPDVTQSLEEFVGVASTVGEGFKSSHTMLPIEEQTTTVPRSGLLEQLALEEPKGLGEERIDLEALGGTFRILGQVNNLYIVLATDDGLVLVDQHAAHERIIYEKLREEVNSNRVVVQELLHPIMLRLGPKDAEAILGLKEMLGELGYAISHFGGNEVLVSTLPEVLGRRASEDELIALVDRIMEVGVKSAKEQFMGELVKLTACHSAIRAGQHLSADEIRRLLTELGRTESRYNCCHGRPSIIRIGKDELDKRFGRTGPEAIARFKARLRGQARKSN